MSGFETVPAQPPRLPGATAPTRYVGATSSGKPVTGTFLVGDFVIDQTGSIWVCTVAGSPGTWLQTGGGSASGPAGGDLAGTYPNPTIPKLAALLAVPYPLIRASNRLTSAVTVGDYPLYIGSYGPGSASGAGQTFPVAQSSQSVFYWDSALYTEAGLTLRMIVYAILLQNVAAPTISFTVGLYPVLTSLGPSASNLITVGAVISGSTVLFTTPAGNSRNQGNSGTFTPPAAGFYALGVNVPSTAAASSTENVAAMLALNWS